MQTLEIIQYYINKRVYWSERGNCWSLHSVKKNQLEYWYEEARRVYKVNLTYEDFSFMVANNVKYPPRKRPRFYRDKLDKSSFRRLGHHEKKTLSNEEIVKREWKKKVNRQGRCEYSSWSYKGSRKYYKGSANGIERRRTRQKMHAIKKDIAEWDNYSNGSKSEYFDWWDYY